MATLIENATPADIPALVDLLAVLFDQEAEFTPDPELQRRGLERILASPDAGEVLVMRDARGRPAAMVLLLYTVSTALGAPAALLEDMVVTPGWRGQGLGGQLLAEAIATARRRGCKRITLLTDADNDGAAALYRKHGFTASAMRPFRLAL